jgi:hypothetical protein
MDWIKIERGHYRREDGFEVIADWHGGDETTERDDPTWQPEVSEWFLYDPDGNMIDAYPTMKAAKASV